MTTQAERDERVGTATRGPGGRKPSTSEFGRRVISSRDKSPVGPHVDGVPLREWAQSNIPLKTDNDVKAARPLELTSSSRKGKLSRQEVKQVETALGLERTPVELDVKTPEEFGPSQEQLHIAQAAPEAEGPSKWDVFKASARNDNTLLELVETPQEFPIDINFKGTEFIKDPTVKARIEALTLSDKEEVGAQLGAAMSVEQAEDSLASIEREHAREVLLLEAGASALLIRMGVSILDPVDMAVTIATLPISGGASSLYKMGRMGRIASAAVTAGTANSAVEAVLASNSTVRDETDVMYAAVGGIVLGGALGSLSRAENSKIKKDLDDIARGDLDRVADRLRGKEPDSVGAAKRAPESLEDDVELAQNARKTFDRILDEAEAPEFRGGPFKWIQNMLGNFQAKLFYSKSESVRTLSSKMMEGGFLKRGEGVRGFTAEGRAQHIRRLFEAGIFRDSLDPFKRWSARNGYGSAKRAFTTSVGEEFYTEVSMAMRGITHNISGEAKEAAAAMRPHMDRIYELAQKAGVDGFDKTGLENYFPRMMNRNKWNKTHQQFGTEALNDFYTRALISGSEEIGDELAEAISRAFVRQMRTNAAGLHNDILDGFRLDDIDKVKAMFVNDAGELSNEAKTLIDMLESTKGKENLEKGQVSFAKRRIRFDESFQDELISRSGERIDLRFTDPLENDARKVMKRYGMTMSGNIGMAQELGIASRREFDDIKTAIVTDAEVSGRDISRAKAEVKALDDAYKLIMGHSIESDPNGSMSQISRLATGYSHSTRGGQFGVNAIAETGNTFGLGSIRSLIRTVPELKSFITRGKDGSLDSDIANTAELLFAPGINTLTGVAIRNFDELGEGFEGASALNRLSAKADPYIKTASRFTSITSGLAGVTDITQRLSAIEWMRQMAKVAKGKKLGKGMEGRLRAAGLDSKMQERIFESIRQSGVFKGKRLTDLDPSKWLDDEALDAFQMAAHRVMRDAIQENDVSNATKLVHHPVGRAVLQFLRFPMEAVNKQLLRGVHHHDVETAKSWMASYFIGSMMYTAQTSLEFANDPEERERRLTPENIARVGFMRTGMSSMIPPVVDNVNALIGNDPWFTYGRSSGLGTTLATSNPSVTLAGDLAMTATLPFRALRDDYRVSQQDWDRFEGLLPFQRLYGVKNALHAIEDSLDLPKTSSTE